MLNDRPYLPYFEQFVALWGFWTIDPVPRLTLEKAQAALEGISWDEYCRRAKDYHDELAAEDYLERQRELADLRAEEW